MKLIVYKVTRRPIVLTDIEQDFKMLEVLQKTIGEEEIEMIDIPEISGSRTNRLTNQILYRFYKPPKMLNKESVLIDYANLLDHVDPANNLDVNQKSKFTYLVWGTSPDDAREKMAAVDNFHREVDS